MQAAAFNGIGSAYAHLGDREKAREHFERAVAIHRRSGDPRLLADTLRNLGSLLRETRDFTRAAASLDEALAIRRTIHDRYGEAAELAELARLERDRGDLLTARERAEEALNEFESLRQTILSPKLRASLVASVHRVHELDLDLLARLHASDPDAGYDGAALFAAERGRARSLLEMLGESGTEIRRGVDESLTARERELQRQIAGKAEQQMRLLGGAHSPADAAAAAKELDSLTAELDQVQSRIRATSPEYAALTQPAPLGLKEIQSKVLDKDTVLLEYALGAKKSFLWVVTPSSLEMFELPPPEQIEAVAKRVYELLTARNRQPANETPAARAARVRQADEAYVAAALKVSRMLLGPAAARIRNKRLLIVADGVLQYLPFAALPEPDGARSEPLIVNHEIATAPSASVVAVLRQETAGRKPAAKALAVLADPVYSAEDPRMMLHAVRSGGPAEATFERLRFSRTEAEEIARLSAPEPVFKALDFDASRDAVLRSDLGQYRIVHFATHSLIDNERPELSGVVLSLVDRRGRPQNGFLRLYDIYNLRLGADLVVLSACRTALGGEIRGEGLIGLTRGFLYAGAPRVVATLWEIDDRTTAEAMKRFYEGMLARGERPAAALRAAQASMWKSKGWDAPYYWAAFTLEGEWR
jgi:CHAT domain-containing protein